MKALIVSAVLAASVAISGCSSLGPTKLEQAQTILQVAYLANNFKSVSDALLTLPTLPSEQASISAGLAKFDKVRTDIAALAKGDVDSEVVLDYTTGTDIYTRIGEAYNEVLVGLRAFSTRTGFMPPPEFVQFNRVAVQIYRKLGVMLESDKGIELKNLLEMLKLALVTLQTVKAGGIPVVEGPTI